MPSKYSRKNRDRKGGHNSSPVQIAGCGFRMGCSDVERMYIKHITKKRARRQHATFIAEGLKEHEQEQDVSLFWGCDHGFQRDDSEDEDYDPYGIYETWGNCDNSFFEPSGSGWGTPDGPEFTVITGDDVGKTIAEFLKEHGYC